MALKVIMEGKGKLNQTVATAEWVVLGGGLNSDFPVSSLNVHMGKVVLLGGEERIRNGLGACFYCVLVYILF